MTRTARAIVVTLACLGALPAPGYGQSRRWSEPYQRGVKAFEAGDFTRAVTELERAVAAEPKAEANKLVEGVYRIDYFPYHYLGLSYTELNQFDQAQANLTRARATPARRLQAKLDAAEAKVRDALDANATKVARRDPAFDAGVRDADALLDRKQFEEAIRKLDQLRSNDPAEYGKAGLAGKREAAVKALITQYVDEARGLIQASRFKDAMTKLQRADELQPNQRAVSELIGELSKRNDDYQRLKSAALTDLSARNYAAARAKLQQAQAVQPELFAADDLNARLTEATRLAERLAAPGPPKVVGPDTSVSDATKVTPKPAAVPNEVTRPSPAANNGGVPAGVTARPASDAVQAALKDGLLALLKGDPQGSIAILEPAAAQANVASLHAYLGVAYATRALSAVGPDARASFHDKAVQAFKSAKSAEPGYQLSPRIVSPAILSIFKEAGQ